MGVANVLPNLLPSIGRKIDIKDLKANNYERNGDRKKKRTKRKCRIAIDVNGWIAQECHRRGASLLDERKLTNHGRAELSSSTAKEETSKGETPKISQQEKDFIVECGRSVLRKVLYLQESADAVIVVVFDGATPPAKQNTCTRRRERRDTASRVRDDLPPRTIHDTEEYFMEQIRAAKRAGAGCPLKFRAIAVSLEGYLRDYRIPFLVAPYEADAQLAYLSQQGLVDLIITEDSDLIAYGAEAILFKFSEESSSGILFLRSDLQFTPKKFSLMDFSDGMLATMFVAAGCDYCPSLPGIGIKTARDIVQKAFHSSYNTPTNSTPALQNVFASIYAKTTKRSTLSEQDKSNYETSFLSALFIYRNSIVFDFCHMISSFIGNRDKELCYYKPYNDLWNDVDVQRQILGVVHDKRTSVAIGEGKICPRTYVPYSRDPYLTQLPFLFPSDPATEDVNLDPDNQMDSEENNLPEPVATPIAKLDTDNLPEDEKKTPSDNSEYTTLSF